MKNTKICPKCSGTEIYTTAGREKRGERSSFAVSSWNNIFIDAYVCTTCGYIEEYLEMKDGAGMEKLKKNWKKMH